MKRFLFVVPPFAGHVLPAVSVARELQRRGHQVLWVGLKMVADYLPKGTELVALDEDGLDAEHAQWQLSVDKLQNRSWESLQTLWLDALMPLARGMYPGVCEVIQRFQPDVVVSDQQAIAGALAARKAGLPWATFCTTSASVVDSLEALPKVKQWVLDQLAALESEAGLEPMDPADTSPTLVVVFSTKEMTDPERDWPPHYLFVGPSLGDRADDTPFPWERLTRRPRVFVSLGTIGNDSPGNVRFMHAVAEGLRDFEGDVAVVSPPGVLSEAPDHFIVQPRVPQIAVLHEMDAVITHAGHNTVCESLSLGLPLVVVPIRHDQPAVASQVVRAGAGIRVRYGRISATALREAVDRVLGEPAFRTAAKRLGEGFRASGGERAAADGVEAIG